MAGARLLVIFQWGRRLGWDDAYSFPPCVDCVCFVCSWDKFMAREAESTKTNVEHYCTGNKGKNTQAR